MQGMQQARLDPWVGKIPWNRHPTPVFLSGKFHGQRRLAGCSPQPQSQAQQSTRPLRLESRATGVRSGCWEKGRAGEGWDEERLQGLRQSSGLTRWRFNGVSLERGKELEGRTTRLEAEIPFSFYHKNLGTQVTMVRIRLRKNKKLLDSGCTWKVETMVFFIHMGKKKIKMTYWCLDWVTSRRQLL